MALKSFSATHFQYTSGDHLGKLCCLLSLLPYIMGVMIGTWFIAFRKVDTVVIGIGVVLNDVINLILKSILKEERPSGTGLDDVSYGMPSRHAQFTAFVCVLLLLKTPFRMKAVPFQVILLSSMLFMAFARVYLQYHTVGQVVVGCLVGAVLAVIWHSRSRSLALSKQLIVATSCLSALIDTATGSTWEPCTCHND